MLHTATVHPATLALLKQIMTLPDFQQFNLVGGTSLSLQIGHRISIDLDLFTEREYDNSIVLKALKPLGHVETIVDKPPFLQVRLDDVKLDFLKFPYSFIQDYVEVEGIRLVSIENIAVMKLMAIARRGVKKDFIDLYFILQRYSLLELVQLFEAKLPNVDMFHILKSLTYFGDADPDADPKMLIDVSWATIKKSISKKTQEYLSNK